MDEDYLSVPIRTIAYIFLVEIMPKLTKSQSYTKNYRQLRKSGSRRGGPLLGRVYHLLAR